MQNKEEIAAKLREFIYAQFPLARQREVGDDASLIEQGIVDSLGVLEIVAFIETQFSIILEDDEMLGENFDSIASLTAFVQAKSDPAMSTDG